MRRKCFAKRIEREVTSAENWPSGWSGKSSRWSKAKADQSTSDLAGCTCFQSLTHLLSTTTKAVLEFSPPADQPRVVFQRIEGWGCGRRPQVPSWWKSLRHLFRKSAWTPIEWFVAWAWGPAGSIVVVGSKEVHLGHSLHKGKSLGTIPSLTQHFVLHRQNNRTWG